MTRSMLIDAAHPEETRIAVVNQRRLENFDYEAAARTSLKGNIYLGKIARVEASLQAAFVEYGGNRHGFLPFADIHPDYYRLPQEDRQALIEEEAAARRESDLEGGDVEDDDADEAEAEANGRDDAQEDRRRAGRLRRQYKIQEVIKRRQIVLVQVSKEERGTKGAALTTYMSLAGRYCVLMPNTGHGGGISRKITNATDRRKLKTIVEGLDVPDGMAVIMRTAGVKRTKTEIKRDYDFLTRTWEGIREDTLSSTAPALIYEEADLVKRAIRDIYGRDIDEVLVEGDRAYRSAKDFMKALMPSHAKRVQQYKDQTEPLFVAHGIEDQLYDLHTARVELPSGGYLVIDSTEALVAIDVNSGRATRERNIEETAVKTNLEAADEVARQLRLRDLAGLIVIDFIDMDERRNNSQVERRLKDALSSDRARVQVGRISALGLLEMSRQRLRPSIHESSTVACPHCNGSGFMRSVESSALQTARAIEQEALSGSHGVLSVYLSTDTALYLLNYKRNLLNRLASDHGVEVLLQRDDSQPPGTWRFESLSPKPREEDAAAEPAPAGAAAGETGPEAEDDDEEGGTKRRRRSRRGGRRRRNGAAEEAATVEAAPASESGETQAAVEPVAEETPKPPRRRRRAAAAPDAADVTNGGVGAAAAPNAANVTNGGARAAASAAPEPEMQEPEAPPAAEADAAEAVEEAPKPRRRRRSRKKEEAPAEAAAEPAAEQAEAAAAAETDGAEAPVEEAPKPRRRRTRRKKEDAPEAAAADAERQEAPAAQPAAQEPPPQEPPPEPAPAPAGEPETPRRAGWWRRQLNLV
ncbi:MAG: ribonuclease E/G [Alphaproteobacteria bacterium]|nr:ribonuclease E/G [Alphaproteobacteria bacterium]